ncbi:MFS transporter [Microbacterium fluvii]|uniref:MFS transporter n=1 Tax=Microbacterium fluvii TaxID=415215 RepID=A0ABW2HGC7_9MICO|nr:MFS transporter [Microbacterium fluvii]MCU4673978.1 MFS transporter [Microbacterium fluvii]
MTRLDASPDPTRTRGPFTAGIRTAPGAVVDWRRGGVAMAVTFSLLQMLNEIGTMMAIPLYGSMGAILQLGPAETAWALLATTLFGAATIPLLSKAGDLFGHRRLMMVSLVGITIGYVLSAIAQDFTILIIGRALTGIMAGQALCIGIMGDRLIPGARKKAVAIIAAGQAVGVFFGFALGGVLLQLGGTFREAFWAGAVLTLISAVAFLLWGSDSDALHRHRQNRAAGVTPRLDVGGVILLGVGLTALCLGISQSTTWGASSPQTLLTVVGGIVLLAVALLWESRSKSPLLPVREIFGRRLGPAYAVFLTLGICGMLFFNFTMGWAQTPPEVAGYGFGLSPLVAACLFLAMSAAGLIAARLATRALRSVSPKLVLVAAALVMAGAFVWLAFGRDSLWALVAGIFVYGAAYTTLLTTAMSIIATEAAAGKGAGTASVYVAVALAASSIGTAVYAAIVAAHTAQGAPIPDSSAYTTGYLTAAAATVFALGAGIALSRTITLREVVTH